MLHSLSGTLTAKKEGHAIVETAGFGFKVSMAIRALNSLPQVGEKIKIFCSLWARENAEFELFGFTSETELYLFQKLNTVNGIGPKTAMGIVGLADVGQLIAAINQGKTDLLTRAAGVGKKTSERVVLDLKGKLDESLGGRPAAQSLDLMSSDADLEETLVSLGYTKAQAKAAIAKIDQKITGFKERLKEALKKNK